MKRVETCAAVTNVTETCRAYCPKKTCCEVGVARPDWAVLQNVKKKSFRVGASCKNVVTNVTNVDPVTSRGPIIDLFGKKNLRCGYDCHVNDSIHFKYHVKTRQSTSTHERNTSKPR